MKLPQLNRTTLLIGGGLILLLGLGVAAGVNLLSSLTPERAADIRVITPVPRPTTTPVSLAPSPIFTVAPDPTERVQLFPTAEPLFPAPTIIEEPTSSAVPPPPITSVPPTPTTAPVRNNPNPAPPQAPPLIIAPATSAPTTQLVVTVAPTADAAVQASFDTPTPTQRASATPTFPPPAEPPPPSYAACQADPNPYAAPNYPVRILGVDKKTEIFEIQNVTEGPINLAGWRMCSVNGSQELANLSDITLQPGEIRGLVFPSGAIWSNSERDDGALYNANGQLISYWFDF